MNKGYFGDYGGLFIPETLSHALNELEKLYIEIKDDYSDLDDKLEYYIENLDKLKEISSNANNYVNQFRDKRVEKIISLLVMDKFFSLSGQKKPLINFYR